MEMKEEKKEEGKKKGEHTREEDDPRSRRSLLRDRFERFPAWRAMTGCSSTYQGERAYESLNTWAKLQGSMPNYETFIGLVDVDESLATKTRLF